MSRYRIRRVTFCPYLPGDPELEDGTLPYGLWDTVEHVYVNKWGQPDSEYWCISREVAVMRRRDLNHYADTDAKRNPA